MKVGQRRVNLGPRVHRGNADLGIRSDALYENGSWRSKREAPHVTSVQLPSDHILVESFQRWLLSK